MIAPSRVAAWSPSPIRSPAIDAERPVVLARSGCDSAAKHILQRPRLGPHGDDRAGETLGFLAAGAAEHQPDQAHQRQRAGEDRDPLRDLRAGQRLVGQRPAGRPGGIAGPQQGQDRQRPAEHLPPAFAGDAVQRRGFRPSSSGRNAARLGPPRLRPSGPRPHGHRGSGSPWARCGLVLMTVEFTTFVCGGKRQKGTVRGWKFRARLPYGRDPQGEFQHAGVSHGARRLDRCLSGG